MFIAALFIIDKTWKQPTGPLTDEWTKMWCIQTIEYYSAIKKKWNNAIFCNMDGPRDYYTKWNKAERKRQIPYDINYVESNMTQMNLSTKQK